jgi:hypothetical protein
LGDHLASLSTLFYIKNLSNYFLVLFFSVVKVKHIKVRKMWKIEMMEESNNRGDEKKRKRFMMMRLEWWIWESICLHLFAHFFGGHSFSLYLLLRFFQLCVFVGEFKMLDSLGHGRVTVPSDPFGQ